MNHAKPRLSRHFDDRAFPLYPPPSTGFRRPSWRTKGSKPWQARRSDAHTVVGEWNIPAGQPYADGIKVKADKTAARGGQVGLRLQTFAGGRLAGVQQRIADLAAGVYEFKVWAKGKGALILTTETLRGAVT